MDSDILLPASEDQRWTDPALLNHLTNLRQPFDGLSRRIVQYVLANHVPNATTESRYLEIGSGGGQLRTWLPEEIRSRTLHTEPSTEYVEYLRRCCPDANVEQASAYSLPIEERLCDAVFGLCTFDALQHPDKARDELRRVLKPGGVFVHFLDLGSDLETTFRDFMVRGELPLPNFLPNAKPLDDLVVTSQTELDRCRPLLQRADPALVTYLGHFGPAKLDARAAMLAYINLVSDKKRLASANKVLRSACTSLELKPFSAVGAFADRLGKLFSESVGFRVLQSEVLRAGEHRRRDDSVANDCVYKGRWIGKTVARKTMPNEIPGTLLDDELSSSVDNAYRFELAMYVFVASPTA